MSKTTIEILITLSAFLVFFGILKLIEFTIIYIRFKNFESVLRLAKKYYLVECFAKGATSLIFLGYKLLSKKPLAIKLLKDDFIDDIAMKKKFKYESKLIRDLNHPNIVKFHNAGEFEHKLYIAMEYLGEKTLRHLINEKEFLNIKNSIHIMVQISEAIKIIHNVDIIHRDLKPDNIMIIEKDGDPYFVKLLDFGIAKFRNRENISMEGEIVGTLSYLAPEVYQSKQLFSKASDIFALGITFYEILTKEHIFLCEKKIEMISKILDIDPTPPNQLRAEIPEELNNIIIQMLKKEAQNRPTIDEVNMVLKTLNLKLGKNPY